MSQRAGRRVSQRASADRATSRPSRTRPRHGRSGEAHPEGRHFGVAVDVAREGVTVPLSAARVRDIVQAVCRRERVRDGMLSVTFVSNRVIAKLNRDFLNHQGATDVITFELSPTAGVTVGDVYIAPDVARTNARLHGTGVREELVRLVIHGTLHVLGYTHPDGASRTTSAMWRTQEALVAALA